MTDFPDYAPGCPSCPFFATPLPGVGGQLSLTPEHFVVDEVPAYSPSGEGEHVFVRLRKRGITTHAAVTALARAADVAPRDVGVAGRKDRHAVTTQWISLPREPVDPQDPAIEILEWRRHGHKLRTGHLRGNRFQIRLTGVHEATLERLPALEAALARGVPNYFGHQRFGRSGAAPAFGFLARPKRRVKDPRFLASVAQSAIFNVWLGARVRDELLHTAVSGDVLKKRETGGLFVSDDVTLDAPRVASGEVDPTGPMWGPKCKPADADAAAREQAALEPFGLTDKAHQTLGRFAPGTRRVARVVPADLTLELDGPDLHVAFTLPAGAFATVVLGALAGAAMHR